MVDHNQNNSVTSVLCNAVKLPRDIATILTRQPSITLNITGPSALENVMKCKVALKKACTEIDTKQGLKNKLKNVK